MINTIFFGINVILLMVIWSKILKPSILDHYRDKFFDLRESVREFYLINKIPLNDRTYISLRDLINAHLQLTEKFSLIKVIIFSYKIEKNNTLKNYLHQQVNNCFKTSNKSLSLHITEVRKRAINILIEYMIFSSPILITMLIITAIISLPIFIIKSISLKVKTELSYIGEVISNVSRIIVKLISTRDSLEELSYKGYGGCRQQ